MSSTHEIVSHVLAAAHPSLRGRCSESEIISILENDLGAYDADALNSLFDEVGLDAVAKSLESAAPLAFVTLLKRRMRQETSAVAAAAATPGTAAAGAAAGTATAAAGSGSAAVTAQPHGEAANDGTDEDSDEEMEAVEEAPGVEDNGIVIDNAFLRELNLSQLQRAASAAGTRASSADASYCATGPSMVEMLHARQTPLEGDDEPAGECCPPPLLISSYC